MSKLVTLDHFGMLATRVKAEDDKLGAQIAEIVSDIEGIVATGGEANVLEGIKVNGTALAIADKMVEILIASGEENGTLSVNGATVAITGLQALAYKSNISESDLDEALKASIAAKATDADLQALTVRVTNAEGAITEIQGDIESLQNAGYQNAEQVQSAITAAIAATGHAHFEKVDAVPSVEDAEENVLYLVMNDTTGHYDIYALVGESVELIDDTTVDLTAYSTTEQMNAAISAAVDALNIGDYAKSADLVAAIARIATLEDSLANYFTKDEIKSMLKSYYTADEIDTILGSYATDDEAAAAASAAVAAATAADSDVENMLTQKFGSEA